MTAKIAAFIVTLLVNVAVGVVVFFFMLLAMNGYSESDANYGLVAYIVLAVLVSLLMSTCAVLLVTQLLRRKFRSVTGMMISITIFSVAGIGLKILSSIIGVLIAEFVRVRY